MSVRSLPQALKTERVKTGKASGSIEQEHSSESDEEIKFGTFHEYFGEKPMHSWLKKPLKRGSKLLKPVGSGCFSESLIFRLKLTAKHEILFFVFVAVVMDLKGVQIKNILCYTINA